MTWVLRKLQVAAKKGIPLYTEKVTIVPGEEELAWWNCFETSSEDSRDFDGTELYFRKSTVTKEDAEWEIIAFKEVQPACPYFDYIYKREFTKCLGREYERFRKEMFSKVSVP